MCWNEVNEYKVIESLSPLMQAQCFYVVFSSAQQQEGNNNNVMQGCAIQRHTV